MRYFISKIGEVRSEESWKHELQHFWKSIGTADYKEQFEQPKDSWDRFARVLGLQEISHEQATEHSSDDSSIWSGVF